MNLEEIKNYLTENKDSEEVQALLQGFNSTSTDDIKAFLESDEGKQLIQPKLDTYFTKGLETWKQNNLEKLINEEVSKRNPDETPEQKRIRELEEYVAQKEREALIQTNKNKALSVLTEKQLPSNLVDFFVAEDEETTLKNLEQFEEVFTNQLQQAVEARLKQDGTSLDNGNSGNGKVFTKEQVANMSTEEINKHWDDIKDLI